jgi:hypothetical protein
LRSWRHGLLPPAPPDARVRHGADTRHGQLGNACWATHLVDADAAAAARFLDKAAAAYRRGAKLDAAAARPLLDRLAAAAEHRGAAQATVQRCGRAPADGARRAEEP